MNHETSFCCCQQEDWFQRMHDAKKAARIYYGEINISDEEYDEEKLNSARYQKMLRVSFRATL